MKWNQRALIALILLVAFIPVFGMAVDGPPEIAPVGLIVDGQQVDLGMVCNVEQTETGPVQICEMSKPIETPEYTIQSLFVDAKGEPYLDYGLAVRDSGAPSTFSFVFGGPISPALQCVWGSSSLSGSTTDGGIDGVTITPTDPSGKVQITTISDGISTVNIGHDLGPTATLFGQSAVYGPFNEGFGPAKFLSTSGWNSIQMDVKFQLSGGGDILTMNGRSDIAETTGCNGQAEFPSLFFPAVALIGMLCVVMVLRIRK